MNSGWLLDRIILDRLLNLNYLISLAKYLWQSLTIFVSEFVTF